MEDGLVPMVNYFIWGGSLISSNPNIISMRSEIILIYYLDFNSMDLPYFTFKPLKG